MGGVGDTASIRTSSVWGLPHTSTHSPGGSMLVGNVAPKSSRDRGHDLVREAAAQGLREAKQQHCAVELGLVVHYGCSSCSS